MFVSIAINTILNRDEQLQFTNCPLHGIVSCHISVQLLLNGNKMKKEKLNCSNCGAFCREENNKWCASANRKLAWKGTYYDSADIPEITVNQNYACGTR